MAQRKRARNTQILIKVSELNLIADAIEIKLSLCFGLNYKV